MRLALFAALGCLALATTAFAEEVGSASGSGLRGGSMAVLLEKGYEIRAAVANGTRYIVFLQKDQSAYACEFVSLTRSRCGSIN
ncbi:hypothetical protein [Sinorhizobium alkalisoli]|uniref:Uncharacterized protein n=1 Tax=Sinorhizobium alkalisoli TaxID=1752398 RepID=A0A1E3V703_9HYPH|nr:hypothetical protein [Sinorhizobium alkalisoli]MCA1489875.1 hypothetical protein [Ensifer sp. NBAIM29]MCG5477754.1 hypothetical protein [Sinorhizobium alkalisoli]ODR89350.1 hypothetical protein A8M32_23250 [Sinorhizobium alkalisoli]QFI65901.1 hypothetical protein EKH55_1027 [Sinorhizobium alkalisoli]